MIIKRATKADLPAIKYLMDKYGKMDIDASLLNNRDIALQARLESGELVGFTWVGLMANNTKGYVDKAVVDPNHAHKGIAKELFKEVLKQCHSRGVKQVIGMVRQDEFHDKCLMGSLRTGSKIGDKPYTLVFNDIEDSFKELTKLGVL
jgi:N-acetylglutamate synthase-like GNAT family acetyltransferase